METYKKEVYSLQDILEKEREGYKHGMDRLKMLIDKDRKESKACIEKKHEENIILAAEVKDLRSRLDEVRSNQFINYVESGWVGSNKLEGQGVELQEKGKEIQG